MKHGTIKYLVFKGIVCAGNLFLFICAERQPPLEQLHLGAVDAGELQSQCACPTRY